MKKQMGTAWLKWVLAFIPAALVLILYNRLPEQVPMNWGFDGAIQFGPRWHLWLIAGISPLLAMLFSVLPKIDPRKSNYAKFQKFYDNFVLGMMLFLLGVLGIMLSECFFPGHISVGVVVTLAVGLLFTFLGNMMPKMKSNFFMGIKTPWTLSSEQVWNRTHRLAGWLWFFSGLLIAASAFIPNEPFRFILMMTIVAVMVLAPVIASYVWFRQETEK